MPAVQVSTAAAADGKVLSAHVAVADGFVPGHAMLLNGLGSP